MTAWRASWCANEGDNASAHEVAMAPPLAQLDVAQLDDAGARARGCGWTALVRHTFCT